MTLGCGDAGPVAPPCLVTQNLGGGREALVLQFCHPVGCLAPLQLGSGGWDPAVSEMRNVSALTGVSCSHRHPHSQYHDRVIFTHHPQHCADDHHQRLDPHADPNLHTQRHHDHKRDAALLHPD